MKDPFQMTSDELLKALGELIWEKGSLEVTRFKQSEMGCNWTATAGNAWPYCSHGTFLSVLRSLVHDHMRIERERLQKRINEIDGSSGL